MGQILHRSEVQEARPAFECVEGAENRVDCVCVPRIALEDNESLLDALQQLDRLAVEFAEEFPVTLQIQGDGLFLAAGRHVAGFGLGWRRRRRLPGGHRVAPFARDGWHRVSVLPGINDLHHPGMP